MITVKLPLNDCPLPDADVMRVWLQMLWWLLAHIPNWFPPERWSFASINTRCPKSQWRDYRRLADSIHSFLLPFWENLNRLSCWTRVRDWGEIAYQLLYLHLAWTSCRQVGSPCSMWHWTSSLASRGVWHGRSLVHLVSYLQFKCKGNLI